MKGGRQEGGASRETRWEVGGGRSEEGGARREEGGDRRDGSVSHFRSHFCTSGTVT